MAPSTTPTPTFSRRRRLRIGFNVVLAVLAVFAAVVMVNYLSAHYFKRFYYASDQKFTLSPRTLAVLDSLTNKVEITLYFSRDEDLYSTLADLLNEYQAHSRGMLSVRIVDYLREPAAAQELSAKYKQLGSSTNVVIFSCEGKLPRIIPSDALMEVQLEQIQSDEPNKLAFRRKPLSFRGEVLFTGALLAVTNPKPFKAYYLEGNGEHPLDNSKTSYSSFVGILRQNYIDVQPLMLLGTNAVPADCELLIIAGANILSPAEIETIDHYLNEGGRLFASFNFGITNTQSGLAKELRRFGVNVGERVVDPVLTSPESPGDDVIVIHFTANPAVNALTGSKIQMIRPLEISKLDSSGPGIDTRHVDEIASTGDHAYLISESPSKGRILPLMVAVSDTAVKQRGSTRLLVVGDSLFLTDTRIESAANRELASLAANWLLERDVLLKGVGPRPVTEYRLVVSKGRMQNVQLILLVAMPGAILLVGGLVWLRRRK